MPVETIRESIKIPSDIKNIGKVSSRIVNLLQERGIDKSLIFDIRLSVEETVINAIEHGNKKDRNRSVTVTFSIDDGRIEIFVEDEGKGFSHTELPDPTVDTNVLRAHGRGVYLIHKLMDSVEYIGRGNKVKLVKNFG
jgi:serine/threonine-protein kinase RsbW